MPGAQGRTQSHAEVRGEKMAPGPQTCSAIGNDLEKLFVAESGRGLPQSKTWRSLGRPLHPLRRECGWTFFVQWIGNMKVSTRSERRCLARSLVCWSLILVSFRVTALILTGEGNGPVRDNGWPEGALAVANL